MTDTIQQLLREASSTLDRVDVEVLLTHILNKPRSYLHAWPEYTLTATELKQFTDALNRRLSGEPVAYITGKQEFWSLPFTVNQHTLIPRPETELLVETALSLFDTNCSMIDLGTGSGCIALALASEQPLWRILACDRSNEALSTARFNAKQLNINSVTFVQSNWLDNIDQAEFDLVLSNPPYIANNDPHLQQGDLRFEPESALISGQDGLNDIRMIAQQAYNRLTQGGWLLLEIGYDQAEAVKTLLSDTGYSSINFQRDLAGIQRVCMAQKTN